MSMFQKTNMENRVDLHLFDFTTNVTLKMQSMEWMEKMSTAANFVLISPVMTGLLHLVVVVEDTEVAPVNDVDREVVIVDEDRRVETEDGDPELEAKAAVEAEAILVITEDEEIVIVQEADPIAADPEKRD